MHITVLMTCAGGTMIPAEVAMFRCSRYFKYRIVGIDLRSDVPWAGMFDLFKQVPTDKSYTKWLKWLVDKEGIDIIIPRSDEEAFALANSNLAPICLISDEFVLAKIMDKMITYKTLESEGIRVPEYNIIRDGDSIPADRIFKPLNERGGRGVSMKPSKYPCMAMKVLEEPCYDVDVAWTGTTHTIIPRIRINPKGIPFWGSSIVRNQKLEIYCRSIAESLGLRGVHDMDLMTNPETGEVELLEVNPRSSGSIITSLAAGYPLWDMAIKAKLDLEM